MILRQQFSGLATALNSKYYSSGADVTMQCGLGVGSEGAAPRSTFWYVQSCNWKIANHKGES